MDLNIKSGTEKGTRFLQYAGFVIIMLVPSCFMFPPGNNEEEPPMHFETNPEGRGPALEIEFLRGRAHYFPLMAVWVEDTENNFIQTLYVARSIATGVFGHGDASTGKWMPGEIRRPAALPFWAHRRGIMADDGLYIPSPENPVADAYTGATPTGSFILNTRLDDPAGRPFYIYFELNQSWDWNGYWTNNKFPGDMEYRSSAQPALVYRVLVDPAETDKEYIMEPAGRSHHSGETGELFDDLHTLTTALEIAEAIVVRVRQQ